MALTPPLEEETQEHRDGRKRTDAVLRRHGIRPAVVAPGQGHLGQRQIADRVSVVAHPTLQRERRGGLEGWRFGQWTDWGEEEGRGGGGWLVVFFCYNRRHRLRIRRPNGKYL